MKYRRFPLVALFFLLGLSLLVACSEPSDVAIRVRANRDNVTVFQKGSSRPLAAPDVTELTLADQVAVDELGWALLALSDSLVVELIRDGDLQIQEATLNEQTALLTLAMNAGVVLNKLDVAEAIDARLRIEGEFAIVTASGTIFLVVREQHTPLEWVIALEADDSALMVTADNTSIALRAGQAVWAAPDGPPGPIVDANIAAVNDWISGLRAGVAQPELGEIVWAPAELAITAADLPDPAPLGTPIDVQRIILTLDPAGTYERMDCNGDGEMDLRARNGRFQFDLRQIIGQKRAIDVEIVNLNPAQAMSLAGFNPANEVVTAVAGANSQTISDGGQILSLRSEVQPFHFAELLLEDGCFSGITLLPPDGSPNGEPPTITPTFTPTPSLTFTPPSTPTATFTPTFTPVPACVPSPPFGWLQYTVRASDTMFNLANRTGVSIPTIKQINCWYSDTVYVGQQLWLPFIPPTITPSATPAIDPVLSCNPLTLNIIQVVKNSSVTVQTSDFPPNRTFAVYMSSSSGGLRTEVGTFDSGHGGSLEITFNIPRVLSNQSVLLLEMESLSADVLYCASASFENMDYGGPFNVTITPTNTSTSTPTSTPTHTPTPTPTSTHTPTLTPTPPTPTPRLPDLTVELISGPTYRAGEVGIMEAVFVVRNIGSVGAKPFTVLADLDGFMQRVAITDGLAPNSDSGEITVRWYDGAPCRFDKESPGKCTAVIMADYLYVIRESNEFNNIDSKTVDFSSK